MTTTTYISCDAPASRTVLARVLGGVRELWNRRKLADLSGLDDQMLRDIGITRDDVRFARNLPLSADAGMELHRISLMRRSIK